MQVLAHNLLSQFTNRQLSISSKEKGKSAEKLSSGYRINRSADDAAGLQISEKMRSQVRGLQQASRNIQDAISLCQVADGALNETHSILQRMRELSVQAANDTNQGIDRDAIQEEINELTKEVDRVANDTNFNSGIYPLKGDNLNNISNNISNNLHNIGYLHTMIRLKYSSSGYENLLDEVGDEIYNGHYINLKMQVDDLNNSLELRTLDGKVIFSGDCGTASHPTYPTFGQPAVLSMYPGNNEYAFYPSLITPSNYFASDFFYVQFYVFDDMNIHELNNQFNKYTLVCSIDENVMIDMYKFEDNNSFENNANAVTYNGDNRLWIQTGANSMQGMFLNLVDATAKAIGITDPALDVTSYNDTNTSISRLDNAINRVSSYRTHFGVQQNRLEYAKSVDDNTAENTQYAESRIRDTDMAEEMLKYSKNVILEQAGQSMLAQANQSTQGILSLLLQ